MQDISQVIEAYQAFPAQFKSVALGTVSSPHPKYQRDGQGQRAVH